MALSPRLDILPAAQRSLWPELRAVPEHFTLYGGTGLALRLGHRSSVDFNFFSNERFDPDVLAGQIAFLRDAERVQVDANTFSARVEHGGPVMVSFFGNLRLGQADPRDRVEGMAVHVASLLDLGGVKAAVVQKRAEAKDCLDIDALIRAGIGLPTLLAAGRVVYGQSFNPLIALKALSYFEDVPTLPVAIQERLAAAVLAVDPARLPKLTPFRARPNDNGPKA